MIRIYRQTPDAGFFYALGQVSPSAFLEELEYAHKITCDLEDIKYIHWSDRTLVHIEKTREIYLPEEEE